MNKIWPSLGGGWLKAKLVHSIVVHTCKFIIISVLWLSNASMVYTMSLAEWFLNRMGHVGLLLMNDRVVQILGVS